MRRRRSKSRPTPVEDILKGVLKKIGLSSRLTDRELVDGWPEIVGKELASHSAATGIEKGVLLVRADNGIWRQELTLLFPHIKKQYSRKFGAGRVREIRWDHSRPR